MERLSYVSESSIDKADAWSAAIQIVADSQLKNAKLAITGALLFTGTYFVHIIEGPKVSMEQLMVSIGNDPRHINIIIIDQAPLTVRKFEELRLAYSGPSQFVARHVFRSIHHTTAMERKRSSEWLTELARQFFAS